jgi:Bacterial PH domain
LSTTFAGASVSVGELVGYVEQTLGAGERVICSTRLHWIIFARSIIALALGIVLVAWAQSSTDIPLAVKFAVAFLIVLTPIMAVTAFIEFATTEIAATTRRFVVKRGLLRRAVMEINAGQLESVSVYQSIFGRVLGYGTIVAGGTGSGIDPVAQVARPLDLRDALNQISARPPPGPQVGAAPAAPAPLRNGAAVIIGDGKFGFPVVAEEHHQDILEALAGGRRESSASVAVPALLLPQPNNPYDPDAVAVFMRGHEVGYPARNVAPEFLRALQIGGYDRAACEAMIVGGWDRGGADHGYFGVRLNACRPFRLESAAAWARRKGR